MELLDFLQRTQNEIRTELADRENTPGEDMPFPEMIFTEIVMRHMADVGMTFDDHWVVHYVADVGGKKIQLSGYALSEDCEQLDLFVSLYRGIDEVTELNDKVSTKAAEACAAFLESCVGGSLAGQMDESSEAFQMVLSVSQGYASFEQIRIYVLTDCKVKTHQFKAREIQGKTIKLEVMDIQRLFNHWQEGKPRDELVVNFEDVAGGALPCVWVPGVPGATDYDYAMTVVPGETLRFLYDKYGARILEANVRSFLSQTGKVNKGISATLREQPERFMAFNNGIVMIADEAHLGKAADGSTGITWLKGLQIVNGGQTTASMYFTKKKYPQTNLGAVRVPAKIIVLRHADQAQEEALIADISRYANSQNAVKQSDLSANKPFHVNLEKYAINTYCPDGFARWFYERASGSYKVMLEREGKTAAGIAKLQSSMPPARRVTKTDLAKFVCAWRQRPDMVSLGGQKNFLAFMEMIEANGGQDAFLASSKDYKDIIAQVIIFKSAQKLIRPIFKAFQANVTAYTVATVSRLLGEQIDLGRVWMEQAISPALGQQIVIWSKEVNATLHESSQGRMISEWAKRKECWEIISRVSFSAAAEDIPELKRTIYA